ncbi:iron transporter [Aliikangiella sp. IMCC44359]|uniref:iron transporter n=1 Tax=Aliikangiella sp. IMCC44359 TaxID=3459125 RepID=UPI00403A7CAF
MQKNIMLLVILSVHLFQFSIAAEKKIGKTITKNGMSINAVYLQAVIMDPVHEHSDHPADIHLEADISAARQAGFNKGDWIPYLGVQYTISKKGTSWKKSGHFIPMLANDGPHYGANVKMNGVGKYHVKYKITPPSLHGFHRHTDKETGISAWWEPFYVEWNFVYLGVGKKGGY